MTIINHLIQARDQVVLEAILHKNQIVSEKRLKTIGIVSLTWRCFDLIMRSKEKKTLIIFIRNGKLLLII